MIETVSLADHPELIEFLSDHKTAVIALPVDKAGTLHAATLLYWNVTDPLKLYFVTSRKTEKYTLLNTQKTVKCAAVVGTEGGTPFTIQMRGLLQEAKPADHEDVLENYYQKRGNRYDDIANPDTCLLEFTPSWARYTDYAKGYARFYLDL